MYVPTMEAKMEAHRLGLGVGYVPQNQIASDIAAGTLVALLLQEPQEDTPSVLAWKSKNRGRALHFLLERLRESNTPI